MQKRGTYCTFLHFYVLISKTFEHTEHKITYRAIFLCIPRYSAHNLRAHELPKNCQGSILACSKVWQALTGVTKFANGNSQARGQPLSRAARCAWSVVAGDRIFRRRCLDSAAPFNMIIRPTASFSTDGAAHLNHPETPDFLFSTCCFFSRPRTHIKCN